MIDQSIDMFKALGVFFLFLCGASIVMSHFDRKQDFKKLIQEYERNLSNKGRK